MMEKVIEKLRKLRLPSMVEAYKLQAIDPNSDLRSFDERFEEIVNSEWETRYNKKLNKFIKKATLKYPDADFDESIYEADRLLDTRTIEALCELTWITDARNILITGSTGAGKTYLANALCITAIRKFYNVKYMKTSAVIHELERAELDGTYIETLKKYSSYDVLAMDDFGLMDLDVDKCRNLFELIDSRESRKPTITISQLPISSWYELFKDSTYADASMDRLIHKAYRIEMNGKNMRNPNNNKS